HELARSRRPHARGGDRRGLREAHAGRGDRDRAAGERPLWWQPAEGAAGQVADALAANPHPRSADPRDRRRGEGRDPSDHLPACGARHGDRPDQRRRPRGGGDGRPDPRLPRRPYRRGVDPRDGRRRGHGACGFARRTGTRCGRPRRGAAMITSRETPTRSRQSGGAWGGFADRILRVRELGLVVVLLLICTIVTARAPRFLDGPNLEQVALSATLVCIVALGQALVILARQIDLSVGAIVAMSAFVTASWLEGRPDGGILTAFLIGCGVGAALGTGNALLVAVARIPAVVATLGTLAIYRGAAIVIARGR